MISANDPLVRATKTKQKLQHNNKLNCGGKSVLSQNYKALVKKSEDDPNNWAVIPVNGLKI